MTGQINQTSPMVNTVSGFIDEKGQVENKLEELEELFSDVSYYNSGTEGAAEIQKQLDRLEAGIKALQEEASALQDEIEKANLKIEDKSDQLVDIISDINGETSAYQESVKKAAREATSEAINNCKANGGTFSTYFQQTFTKKLNLVGVNMGKLKQLYADYDKVHSSIQSVSSEIDAYLNKVDVLEGKLNNTNATANLLKKTKNGLASTMEGAYKNVDTDKNIPQYSGRKEEVANKILNTDYDSTKFASMETKEDIQNKWLEQIPENAKITDPYNQTKNPELKNLGEAIHNGMLDELQQAGMSKDEILTFISKNWTTGRGNNGIHKQEDGSWYFPAGHGTTGHKETTKGYEKDADGSSKIYTALKEFAESKDEVPATASSAKAEDVSMLYSAMNPKDGSKDILTQLYNEGFTFKEAMYIIVQKFPDAGISYDPKDGKRAYNIVADNSQTKTLYKDFAAKVLQYWNVGGTTATSTSKSVKTEQEQGDPITFQAGNATYTFIQDRNNDGTFDYSSKDNNDLLGSQNGIDELIAYDTDGDNKISGDELKSLMIMKNVQEESVGTKEDVDKYKDGSNYKEKGAYTNSVDFNISYTSAFDLGIESIDLSTIQQGDENAKSANGSSLLNTFEITMDKDIWGKKETFTAKETNDTDDHLNTYYKQVADNAHGAKNNEKIYSTITESDFEKAQSDYYNSDASSTASIIQEMKDYLEDAKAQSEAVEDPDMYGLNMSWSEIQELYGVDGKSGTYVNMARNRAANTANAHYHDTETAANTSAIEAVKEDMNAFQEEHKVKMKKDEKEEPIDDI